jgi:hypothetical protein
LNSQISPKSENTHILRILWEDVKRPLGFAHFGGQVQDEGAGRIKEVVGELWREPPRAELVTDHFLDKENELGSNHDWINGFTKIGYSGLIASSRSVTASSDPPESVARPLAAKEMKNCSVGRAMRRRVVWSSTDKRSHRGWSSGNSSVPGKIQSTGKGGYWDENEHQTSFKKGKIKTRTVSQLGEVAGTARGMKVAHPACARSGMSWETTETNLRRPASNIICSLTHGMNT